MSHDDFDTSAFASGGERPPITGRQWSTARIANAFDVPAHLVGDPPPDPFYPSEFMRMLGRVHLPHLFFAHDPAKVLPLVDRCGAKPVKIGDGVIVQDEAGNAMFSGTVDRPIFDRWADFGHHFSISPTTKETTMHTQITINAIGPHEDNPPSAVIEVDHDGPSSEPLERAIATGQTAAREMLDGLGLRPHSTKLETVVSVGEDPMNAAIARDRALLAEDAPAAPESDDAPDGGEGAGEAAQRRAMYAAIGTAVPNIIDMAKELAEHEEQANDLDRLRTRIGILSRTLSTVADGLTQARETDIPF